MTGIIVGIKITIMIPQVGHQFGGGIAQMQRYRLVAGATHEVEGLVDGKIGTVALLACGQIDGCLGERYPAFRPTNLIDCIKGGICQQEGVGIGKTNVLGCTYHKTTGYKLWVLTTLNHTSKPIERGIGDRKSVV